MKTVCPRCHSTDVHELHNEYSGVIDELLSPTALVGLGVAICKSFKVHPAIGVGAGTAVATILQIVKAKQEMQTLGLKQHQCGQCHHIF